MGSLPLRDEYGDRINEVLLEFVKGRDRLIERRRQLLCPELGGYGLVDAKIMNVCMEASWVERWKRELPNIDYMVATVWNIHERIGTGAITLSNIQGKGLPIMEDIVKAWLEFKSTFYEWGNNIKKAQVFGNESILVGGIKVEDLVFEERRYREIEGMLYNVTMENICNEMGGIKEKVQLERTMGITLSWVEYFRMRTEITNITIRYPRREQGLTTEQNIDEYTSGKKRGCKRYRRIMEGKYSKKYIENGPVGIAAAITLWGGYIGDMGRELIERNYKLWTCAILESGYKDILFKYLHGKLYLNNQLANFADVRRECTFCVLHEEKQMRNENVLRDGPEYLRRLSMLSAETVPHLLWGCRWVNNVIQSTFNRLTAEDNMNVNVDKYMGGWLIEQKWNMELVLIVIHFVKHVIYVCRNRRILPTVVHVRYEIEELFKMLGKRKKWRGHMTNLGETLRGIFQ
jgi:hypothetical protein